jgi:two-component system sensor histidine kinase HydH
VAHEIRNPLSSIKGIASYFRDKYGKQADDDDMAGVMIEEVERMSRVITELLDFAKPAALCPVPSSVNDLLAHSVRLVSQEAMARNIDIRMNLPEFPLMTIMDPDRLAQCLLNIYLNAFQAMDKGGGLTITGFVRNDAIVVEVRDTGKGIGPDDLVRIFDPYFTTKPRGTGLGLAIVHKIMDAHGGSVKVRSEVGKGSVFSLILPLKTAAGGPHARTENA